MTRAKASIWQPKAQRIQQLSNNTRNYIKVLKVQPAEQASVIGKALFDTLIALKTQLLDVLNPDEFPDNILRDDIRKTKLHFARTMPVLSQLLPGSLKNAYKQGWLDSNFSSSNRQELLMMLNKTENDILVSENMLIDYFSSNIGYLDGPSIYTSFSAIATLSSSYVKTGQPIEVWAGVGSFSDASSPRIFINGNRIPFDDGPVARYKFKTRGKPGKHVVEVKIEYTKPDGVKAIMDEKLKYIIAE
jgi:hypothetical protein